MPPILIKILAGAAGAVLLVFTSFQWGRSDQRADYQEEMRKIEQDHITALRVTESEAYRRGVASVERLANNEEIINEGISEAFARPNSDELCWTDVERLLDLQ